MKFILLFALTHITTALRVAFFGDAGANTKAQEQSFKLAQKLNPDTYIALGDNFYPSGVNAENLSYLFKRVWGSLTKHEFPIPPMFIMGNHDHRDDPFAQQQLNKYNFKNLYYRTELANLVEVIALDTTSYFDFDFWNKHKIDPTEQMKFLKQVLKKPKKLPWRIVIAHHNLLSITKHFQEKFKEKEELRELLESHGVDFVFGGHSHCFERCVSGHTNYFVIGSSAKLDRGVHGTNPKCKKHLFETGFATMEFTNTTASLQFHSQPGYSKVFPLQRL